MAMAEIPMMRGPISNGPSGVGPGQGDYHSGYDASLAMGAVKDMTPVQKVEAVASDVGFEIREHELKWNIDSVDFSIKKQGVKDHRFGKEKVVNTVVFDKFGGKALQDVTLETTDGGKLWERMDRISQSIANTEGESWHAWISPGTEDRLYVAHNKGNGEGELHSVRLFNTNSESRWNLVEALSGETYGKNKDIRDVTIVRKAENPLSFGEVVTKYTQSLPTIELLRLSPFLDTLRQEASIPQEVVRQKREEQEKWIEKQVDSLLKEKDTQVALGLVAQAVSSWARNFESREEEKETSQRRETKVIHTKIVESTRTSLLRQKEYISSRIQDRAPVQLKSIARRGRGHSGGYGFRWTRRDNEKKLAGGIEIVPRKTKLKAEEVGAVIVNMIKNKRRPLVVFNYQTAISPHYIPKNGRKYNLPVHLESLPFGSEKTSQKHTKNLAKGDILLRYTQFIPSQTGKRSERVSQPKVIEGRKTIVRKIDTEFLLRDKGVYVMGSKPQGKEKNLSYRVREKKKKMKRDVAGLEQKKGKKSKKEQHTGVKFLGKEMIFKGKKERKQNRAGEKKMLHDLKVKLAQKEKRLIKELRKLKKKEIRFSKEKKKFQKLLRYLDQLDRVLKNKDKKNVALHPTLKLLKKKDLLKVAAFMWGRESKLFKRYKEGKITRKMLDKLRKKTILRMKKLDIQARKERKITRKILKTSGREWFQRFKLEKSNGKGKRSKTLQINLIEGKVHLQKNDKEKQQIKKIFKLEKRGEKKLGTIVFEHSRRRKKKLQTLEKLYRRHINQKEMRLPIGFNIYSKKNGYVSSKRRIFAPRSQFMNSYDESSYPSFEYIRPIYQSQSNGISRNVKKIHTFPSFGIIYRYQVK